MRVYKSKIHQTSTNMHLILTYRVHSRGQDQSIMQDKPVPAYMQIKLDDTVWGELFPKYDGEKRSQNK